MNIIESIEKKYDGLTRKQKLIADYMRSHAEDMCFLTLKELSAATDVSEMTVLKLCGILGCGSYNELKQGFRTLASEKISAADSRPTGFMNAFPSEALLEDRSGLFGQVCHEELEGVNDFLRSFSIEEYRKAARMICRARGVVLLGSGVAFREGSLLGRLVMSSGIHWMGIGLAVVLYILTNHVKATKKLHPIVFIAASAVIGVVFGFADV